MHLRLFQTLIAMALICGAPARADAQQEQEQERDRWRIQHRSALFLGAGAGRRNVGRTRDATDLSQVCRRRGQRGGRVLVPLRGSPGAMGAADRSGLPPVVDGVDVHCGWTHDRGRVRGRQHHLRAGRLLSHQRESRVRPRWRLAHIHGVAEGGVPRRPTRRQSPSTRAGPRQTRSWASSSARGSTTGGHSSVGPTSAPATPTSRGAAWWDSIFASRPGEAWNSATRRWASTSRVTIKP